MTLSIIIVAYNASDDLARCLASLHAAPPSIAHDITVVDNASTDRGLEHVLSRWPGVRVLPLDRNRGFAAGNNAGIRATRASSFFCSTATPSCRRGRSTRWWPVSALTPTPPRLARA